MSAILAVDTDGWIDGARRLPSPNCAARAQDCAVALAVIHGISLPPGAFGSDDIIRLFLNKLDCDSAAEYESLRDLRVSAHFLIRRDGELLQFVSCDDVAWHAGDSSWRGRAGCNDFSLGIEMEGADDVAYNDSQYEKLTALFGALVCCYPDIVVAGHSDIAPARKTDPGKAFDWQRLFAEIGEASDGR